MSRFPFPPLPGAGLVQHFLESFQPPEWMTDEIQNRLVLFLNHVLMQEPVAQERVRHQQGKSARMVWGRFDITLKASPAGLFERVNGPVGSADLTVTLTESAVPALIGKVAAGEKPDVNIAGDVQLAAEVAWMVDNLRWDMEEDLSRLIGDAPAHAFCQAASAAAEVVKTFALQWRQRTDGSAATP
ncbi:MAG: hypothetical protein ACOVO0_11865 [Burkholderiaceae bacterium]